MTSHPDTVLALIDCAQCGPSNRRGGRGARMRRSLNGRFSPVPGRAPLRDARRLERLAAREARERLRRTEG
jgi:hypothetical protein